MGRREATPGTPAGSRPGLTDGLSPETRTGDNLLFCPECAHLLSVRSQAVCFGDGIGGLMRTSPQ